MFFWHFSLTIFDFFFNLEKFWVFFLKFVKLFENVWKVLGLFWECFGTCLEHFWKFLEKFWEICGKFWEHFWDNFGGKIEKMKILCFSKVVYWPLGYDLASSLSIFSPEINIFEKSKKYFSNLFFAYLFFIFWYF